MKQSFCANKEFCNVLFAEFSASSSDFQAKGKCGERDDGVSSPSFQKSFILLKLASYERSTIHLKELENLLDPEEDHYKQQKSIAFLNYVH